MSGLFNKLMDYMDSEDWKYEILEGETILRFHFKTPTGRLLCFGDVDEHKHFLIFYTWLPISAPEKKLCEVGEYLTRANRGINIGNFELDYDTADICYKTSVDIEGGELTNKMIDNLLRANLSTVERYFRGLMEVIFSDRVPREVIQEIEMPDIIEAGLAQGLCFQEEDDEDPEPSEWEDADGDDPPERL